MNKEENRPLVVALNRMIGLSSEEMQLTSMSVNSLNTAKNKLAWMLKIVDKELKKRKRTCPIKRKP